MDDNSLEQENKYTLPSVSALQHASKKAIIEDKPILLDYWTKSCDNSILLVGIDADTIYNEFSVIIKYSWSTLNIF